MKYYYQLLGRNSMQNYQNLVRVLANASELCVDLPVLCPSNKSYIAIITFTEEA